MNTSIYVSNKYNKLYHSIINNAISKNRYKSKEHYYENHHIIPNSFGGSNKPTNKVLLTAREHYICHYLLTKFTIGKYKSKMTWGFHMMNIQSKNHQRYSNSKLYENIKLESLIKNKKLTDKHKNNLSKTKIGKLNPKFKGYWITPHGKFESSRLAETESITYNAIQKWCKNPDKPFSKGSITQSNYLKSLKINHLDNITPRDLGFVFEYFYS